MSKRTRKNTEEMASSVSMETRRTRSSGRTKAKQTEEAADTTENLYYGKRPPHVQDAMRRIPIFFSKQKYQACSGLNVADLWQGQTVLDVGCYSGANVFLFSHLVGPEGKVYGTDISKNGLRLAEKQLKTHEAESGLNNVQFVMANTENLRKDAKFENETFDIVHSNYSIHILHDVDKAFAEISSVLKEGGEFYFCDAVTSEAEVERFDANKAKLGNKCCSKVSTPSWVRYHELAAKYNLSPPFISSIGPTESYGECKEYRTVTYRFFKLPKTMMGPCEAKYKGNIAESPDTLVFSSQLKFQAGDAYPATQLCSTMATILKTSRFRDSFSFISASAESAKISDQRQHQRTMNPFTLTPDWGHADCHCNDATEYDDADCCENCEGHQPQNKDCDVAGKHDLPKKETNCHRRRSKSDEGPCCFCKQEIEDYEEPCDNSKG